MSDSEMENFDPRRLGRVEPQADTNALECPLSCFRGCEAAFPDCPQFPSFKIANDWEKGVHISEPYINL